LILIARRGRRGLHPYRKFIPSFGPHNTGITEKEGWDHKINKQVERKAYIIRNVAKPNVCQVSAIAFPAASF
jgi:hypothetical protein